ncbi:polyamine-modulated factor 1 [Polymixia lowei]
MDEHTEAVNKESTGNVCTAETSEGQTSDTKEKIPTRLLNDGNVEKRRETRGPPGSRLKLFNSVMDKSLKKYIDGASFHRFAKTFHPFYKRNPQVMENIHKQFIADLQRTIQEDISRLIVEGELQCKLDELDKLEKAAEKSTDPTWRPSGVPEQDLCSFVMPFYQKQKVYLQQELKKIQGENAALAQKVLSGREGITQTEQRIATAADEWKASVREYQSLASSLCPIDDFDV